MRSILCIILSNLYKTIEGLCPLKLLHSHGHATGCCERLDKGSHIAGETRGQVGMMGLNCWNVYLLVFVIY